MFYREVWLWYVIEMSSVCDSYWFRDYHDDTKSRVLFSETQFISAVLSDAQLLFVSEQKEFSQILYQNVSTSIN